MLSRFSGDPITALNNHIRDLKKIAGFADQVKQRFQQLAGGGQAAVDTVMAQEAINELREILDIVENLEVRA